MAIELGISGVEYDDLHRPAGLKKLFQIFREELKKSAPDIFVRYENYLSGTETPPLAESQILVDVAPHVSMFLARLFRIEENVASLRLTDLAQKPIHLFKRDFVQRRALKKFSPDAARALNLVEIEKDVVHFIKPDQLKSWPEESVAACVIPLLEEEKILKSKKELSATELARMSEIAATLEIFEKYVAAFSVNPRAKSWLSFHVPRKIDDFEKLVECEPAETQGIAVKGPDAHLRRRDAFDLTDKRMTQKQSLGEVDYCIYCHDREKDSCSKGLIDKKTGAVQKNPLGITLSGCPLDEKISESHLLRKDGDAIGALALVMIDNPMCPGTGHRICNDCMKSCIFQKQEPVNIPQIETNSLMNVLTMPWGFEIYSLLSRWNPLNRRRPYALPYNGKNILVVGMGPAGYTLAHYLLNEGFAVTGIDGLKIEPLPESIVGAAGKSPPAIRDIKPVFENLNDRVLTGFGGVAEYGITVRWDKNFLKVIYMTLARRDKFSVYGGVRFGGTLSIDDAWNLGFSHIAMATGAGKPTMLSLKNNLIRGIRKASDFLMALQLTGAFKKSNMANLQIRLPAVVVGGGLTAIDTATEIMAYYPVQVEKFLSRFETLAKTFGEDHVLKAASAEDKIILQEFLAHGREIRAERERAAKTGEPPNFVPLIRSWGGVTVAYRKRLIDAPAYRLNHEEVEKAFEEGVYFAENLSPVEAERDTFGALAAVRFEKQILTAEGKWRDAGEFVTLPARAMCVAAGTSPNTIYEKEKPGTFQMDERRSFFQAFAEEGGALAPAKNKAAAFFTSYDKRSRRISFYGDNHPSYAGNVVKAMASAKNGYPRVVEIFADEIQNLKTDEQPKRELGYDLFARRIAAELSATVHEVKRLTPTIIEVIVHAPLAARNFEPGQFYRLQNFEADATVIEGTKLLTEGVALTGAWTDKERGLLSLIILEMGVSSRLCGTLRTGQHVVVMGPTGAPTEIPENETVLLAGGGLGNAVLFSIAKAMKSRGNRVIYFAGYKDGADVFKREEIEAATDLVVWSNDTGNQIKPQRSQDRTFTGNIVQAMIAYQTGKIGDVPISLLDVDRIIAIGSDRMMNGVREARHTVLKPYLKENHVAVGSINSPMQCMMKQVCAQCLQKHVDPKTGAEVEPVYSCFNQDQNLDAVDFKNLNERLQANHLQEIIALKWYEYLLTKQDVQKV